MPIQSGAPAKVSFSFRQYDERGRDVGPVNLDNPENQPRIIVLEKPRKVDYVRLTDADLTVVDATNGLADWTAPAGTLDVAGTWKAQAFAGDWPSRIVAFVVNGPNLPKE